MELGGGNPLENEKEGGVTTCGGCPDHTAGEEERDDRRTVRKWMVKGR